MVVVEKSRFWFPLSRSRQQMIKTGGKRTFPPPPKPPSTTLLPAQLQNPPNHTRIIMFCQELCLAAFKICPQKLYHNFLPLLEQMQKGLNLHGVILALSKIWVLRVEGRLTMSTSHQTATTWVTSDIPGGRILYPGPSSNLKMPALTFEPVKVWDHCWLHLFAFTFIKIWEFNSHSLTLTNFWRTLSWYHWVIVSSIFISSSLNSSFNFVELLLLKFRCWTIRPLIVTLLTIDCVLGSRFAIIDCSINIAF